MQTFRGPWVFGIRIVSKHVECSCFFLGLPLQWLLWLVRDSVVILVIMVFFSSSLMAPWWFYWGTLGRTISWFSTCTIPSLRVFSNAATNTHSVKNWPTMRGHRRKYRHRRNTSSCVSCPWGVYSLIEEIGVTCLIDIQRINRPKCMADLIYKAGNNWAG